MAALADRRGAFDTQGAAGRTDCVGRCRQGPSFCSSLGKLHSTPPPPSIPHPPNPNPNPNPHPCAARYQKTALSDARVIFYGSGSSAVGVAEQIAAYMEQASGCSLSCA